MNKETKLKLRYLENHNYYDVPLSDLFMDMETYKLYLSFIVTFDDHKFLHYVVREVTPEQIRENNEKPTSADSLSFFHTIQKDVDFFFLDREDWKENKPWNETHGFWEVEVRPLTDEERIKYDDETRP